MCNLDDSGRCPRYFKASRFAAADPCMAAASVLQVAARWCVRDASRRAGPCGGGSLASMSALELALPGAGV